MRQKQKRMTDQYFILILIPVLENLKPVFLAFTHK